MDELLAASEEDLSNVEEVGPVIAQSVYNFVHSKRGEQAVRKLRDAGLDMTSPKKVARAASGGALGGKTLVVTGTLSKYKREEIQELIVQHGGRAASGVSKKTDYLVAGEDAGSKLDKAKQLGVAIIGEAEFDELIGKS
jgi:DNA ligase (NAD+)